MKKALQQIVLLTTILVFLQGCGEKPGTQVEQLKVVRGDGQCALHNSYCKDELVVEAFGQLKKGFLGGEGERPSVSGEKIIFEPLDGSDVTVECANPLTDHGGVVRAKLKTGGRTGDNYIRIYPEKNPSADVVVRIVSGVVLSGSGQQTTTGEIVEKPISLVVQGAGSEFLKDVPVYFKVVSSPGSSTTANCKPSIAYTDENGKAETTFKAGEDTGTYGIVAEVSAPSKGIAIRGIEIKGMALNIFAIALVVAGGLAMFIFGMKMMSDGLQLVAGDRMREILKFFTNNRFTAVIAGAVVTGIIQSSSACTVMVVGFVNAGLLTLFQAIGVIFGANIGTTMTAQMISFKLEVLALPAVILGVIMLLLAKKSATKGWAQAILGFGMLFYGMIVMAHELKGVSDFPDFISFFRIFDCEPVNGRMPFLSVLGAIGVGTAMTLIIQSSSATIGIALALASSGLINFWTAVPLILGDNIGTTITAILASIGTNERAKQAALTHVLFNVFGVIYMTLLFYIPYPGTDIPIFLYLIDAITAGDVFSAVPQNIERHIAMAHTMFNVFNVILFLPFIVYFVKICEFIIKIPDEKLVKTTLLEPHLLDTPAVAIQQVVSTTYLMLEESCDMVKKAMNEYFFPAVYDPIAAEQLAEREKRIDQLQEEATEYMVQITARPLTEHQAEIIPLLMHCVNDAERIADHTEILMEFARRMSKAKNKLSDDALDELKTLWGIIENQSKSTMVYFKNTDIEEVKKALEDEKRVDEMTVQLENNHIERMKKGKCKVRAGVIYIEILAELEKIADHLTNIAERTPAIIEHKTHL